MKRSLLLAVAVSLMPQLALADCRAIVTRTVAEMRAGAAEWSDDMERLARAAAGSACVKATSAPVGAPANAGLVDESVGVAATSGVTTAPAASGDDAQSSAGAKTEDEEWSPLKGFKFNPVTGAPGKKPYERRREVFETEEERER